MSVVINEFEVVAEPPAPTSGREVAEAAPATVALAPTPHDVEQIIRRQMERLARVWAH